MIFNIRELQVGMVVKKDIYDRKGIKLLVKANTSLSIDDIEILESNKIEEIDVIVESDEIDKYNLDAGVVESVNKKKRESILDTIKSQNINNIKKCASEIISATSEDFKYSLIDYIDASEDLYDRDIRTAIFASIMAREINKQINDSDFEKNVVSACLLRNIGRVCSDSMEMNKIRSNASTFDKSLFTKLSDDMFLTYSEKYNTVYSYNMLSDENEMIKMMVLLSNENMIGSGYLGATSEIMNAKKRYVYGSKIIKVCNEFDKLLCSAMKNKKVNNVYDELLSNNSLDNDMVKLLTRIIPLYSPGCKVSLTNGHFAVVVKSTPEKPVVKDVDEEVMIDLNNDDLLDVKSIIGSEIKFSTLF